MAPSESDDAATDALIAKMLREDDDFVGGESCEDSEDEEWGRAARARLSRETRAHGHLSLKKVHKPSPAWLRISLAQQQHLAASPQVPGLFVRDTRLEDCFKLLFLFQFSARDVCESPKQIGPLSFSE
jgi:hypothetical protein